MRFVIIDPVKREMREINCKELPQALRAAGLKSGNVDFGMLWRNPETSAGVSIVVYEFGMFEPPSTMAYFSIGSHLYAGAAVAFAHDYAGETVDLDWPSDLIPRFFASADEVEAAIAADEIVRPQISTSADGVVWQWPQQKPGFIP